MHESLGLRLDSMRDRFMPVDVIVRGFTDKPVELHGLCFSPNIQRGNNWDKITITVVSLIQRRKSQKAFFNCDKHFQDVSMIAATNVICYTDEYKTVKPLLYHLHLEFAS